MKLTCGEIPSSVMGARSVADRHQHLHGSGAFVDRVAAAGFRRTAYTHCFGHTVPVSQAILSLLLQSVTSKTQPPGFSETSLLMCQVDT